MNEVTKEDLRDVRNSILREMAEGFNRVNDRLDTLNGRTVAGEVESAKHTLRISSLERRVYARRRADTNDDKRTVMQRDVKMVIAGVTGTVAVLAFFWKILPALLKAL